MSEPPLILVPASEADAAPSCAAPQSDTGLVALAMLARFHNIAADADQLAHDFKEPGRDFSVSQILLAAKQLGLKARQVRTDLSRLSQTPLPAMAIGSDGQFFIVARVQGEPGREQILIHDPCAERPQVLSAAELDARWSNELILFASRASLAGELAKFDFTWFIPAVVKYRKWLGALATLLLVVYAGNHWLIGPHLNPNPTRRVALSGAFPYAQGWDFRLRQEFYTTAALCQITARIFFLIPVAEVARERQVPVPVKRIDDTRYEAEYFEDYYEPGLCGWESGFVYADAIRGKENMYGGALLGFPRKYNKIDYDCSDVVSTLATGREVRKRCYEHDRRSFDAAKSIGEINFRLKGEGQ